MDVCKCENLNFWGGFDVVQTTARFTTDNGYLKEVQFEFLPKHRTKRFLLFCGALVPVGADDGAVRDVIVKVRRDRPAADDYWALYFARLQLAHAISIKFGKLLNEDEDRDIDFIEEYEVRFNGYSQWDEFMMQFKEYDHRTLTQGEHLVVQQYLHGKFEKFTETDSFLEALKHYSYHFSEGKYVFWGFRGVLYEDLYRLTTPFIHSVAKTFGPRDKGFEGIKDFFDRHVCSDICEKWIKPQENDYKDLYVDVNDIETKLPETRDYEDVNVSEKAVNKKYSDTRVYEDFSMSEKAKTKKYSENRDYEDFERRPNVGSKKNPKETDYENFSLTENLSRKRHSEKKNYENLHLGESELSMRYSEKTEYEDLNVPCEKEVSTKYPEKTDYEDLNLSEKDVNTKYSEKKEYEELQLSVNGLGSNYSEQKNYDKFHFSENEIIGDFQDIHFKDYDDLDVNENKMSKRYKDPDETSVKELDLAYVSWHVSQI